MSVPIEDQVIGFYHDLFESVFWNAFEAEISGRLRRNAVQRAVEASADAASQSLTRFFLNLRLTEGQAGDVLNGLARLGAWIELDLIANPNLAPEILADAFDGDNPCPDEMKEVGAEPLYRVALGAVVQVLMLVGPVMAEWRRISFSGEFELLDRVIDRLNEISAGMGAMAESAEDAEDERFELTYRDYLLQRFFRVEAGTVRMTTNVNVDLRELFVMPRVLPRPVLEAGEGVEGAALAKLMDLAKARAVFQARLKRIDKPKKTKKKKDRRSTPLEQVLRNRRTVVVGTPGSGKSTFLEWLQLRTANADQEFILGRQQAIPLLLRVRQLDPENLPLGVALIEKATASRDRAGLMPEGWIERQMEAGRVLLMVDGLDETEPELRDRYVLPWLEGLCKDYPDCAYVVSSRPAGYPPGTLRSLDFVECDLCDFGRPHIEEYCRHWCTAVRLAQHEAEEEARREGQADGAKIVAGFKQNPYIRDLARNPLMLSAICLVNYFEGGQLPEDRAKLYQLCVEGLLHHWDQRRGIHSEFTLHEKLRVCREVAIAMQAENLAEYEASRLGSIFAEVLGDAERADALLEHIRYRTGLLLERRAGVYAFAHLTFQEYLAASAVHEGNRIGIDAQRLANEHRDGRWEEVIALYCGLATTRAAREIVERLVSQPESSTLVEVLTEALLSAGARLSEDASLKRAALTRIATSPCFGASNLDRFSHEEIAPIANEALGERKSEAEWSESLMWLLRQEQYCDLSVIHRKFSQCLNDGEKNASETNLVAHLVLPYEQLCELTAKTDLYSRVCRMVGYKYQAEVAFVGLLPRLTKDASPSLDTLFLRILRVLADVEEFGALPFAAIALETSFAQEATKYVCRHEANRCEAIALLDRWADRLERFVPTDTAPRFFPKEEPAHMIRKWSSLMKGEDTTD